MKDWPWMKWVGKFLLAAVAVIGAIFNVFELTAIPWLVIVMAAGTQVAQWLIALIPGSPWFVIVGKLLLLIEAVVTGILAGIGVQVDVWVVVAPMIIALGQYFLNLIPQPEPT